MEKKVLFVSVLIMCLLASINVNADSPTFGLEKSLSMISVTNCDDARSIVVNPALLGIDRGFRGLYYRTYSDSSSEGDNSIFLTAGNLGFSAEWLSTSNNLNLRKYTIASGENIFRGFYLGSSYSWFRLGETGFKDFSSWDVGLSFRPSDLISLGTVLRNLNRPKYSNGRLDRQLDFGLGIRPLNNRLTFTVDGRLSEDESFNDIKPIYGVEVEAIDGIVLSGSSDSDGNFSLGFELNLAQLGAGFTRLFNGNADHKGGSYVRFSKERFRTIFKRKNNFVEFKLSGKVVDERPGFNLLGGGGQTTRGIVKGIEKAKRDETIVGILLKLGHLEAGYGKVQEIRKALLDFRSSGKRVVCYMESGGDKEYYLATASDRIILPPAGYLGLTGMVAEVTFIKGTLDKIGIKADLEKIGEYKSAADLLTRESMSEEHREAVNSILDDLYDQMTVSIAAGRKLSVSAVKRKIDQGPYTAKEAFEAQLVDTLAYYDEVLNDGKFPKIDGREFVNRIYHKYDWGSPPKIAVIYASGLIVSGESKTDLLTGTKVMGSETIAEAIKEAREDRSIRAIVFRIDSSGGSGLASDVIWREVNLTKGKKPFIISMADVAASGGYYVACAADTIVAEPGTITGSIGVIAGKFDMGGLYDRVGLKAEIITRGENADIYTSHRGFSEKEREIVKRQIREFYGGFVNKVAEGRNMTYEKVDAIGRGRVWTGRQGQKTGLVDKLGGLDLALAIAKEKAKIDKDAEVEIVSLPRKKGFLNIDFNIEKALLPGSDLTESLEALDWARVLADDRMLLLMPYSLEVK